MHIEPMIKKLKKGWLWKIVLYVLTNVMMAIVLQIWEFPIWKIILTIAALIVYLVCYENLGIAFDRMKSEEKEREKKGD